MSERVSAEVTGAAGATPPLTLTDLFGAWRRRWTTLLAGLALGTGLAAIVHGASEDSFEAVTIVQVESPHPQLIDMAVEEAVATSRRVSDEALDTLGDTSLTIERLEASTSARSVDSSHVLHVTFSASTPAAAALGADALAQAYLAARSVDAAADDASATRPIGRIVDPARVPDSPTGPPGATWWLAGAGLGLGVAAPLAARPVREGGSSRSRAARAS